MEKANLSGWSLKSLVRRVDLPVPLGPQMTMGRSSMRLIAMRYRGGMRGGGRKLATVSSSCVPPTTVLQLPCH